ncbi:hypothetical protein HDE_09619 [Halotydeus destructor]|nr:hypothetical protein HDE_09619 [Halotydeus destructor]
MDDEDCIEADISELKSFPLPVERVIAEHPCVTERYFEVRFFVPNEDQVRTKNAGDQVILFHSNRICLISLAPGHEVLKLNKTIESIDFVGKHEAGNRLMNKVSGKGKRGGQKLKEDSVLCEIKTSDGKKYSVLSCMRGNLIEINEKLVDKPQLLTNQPWSEGFIAIQFSNIPAIKHLKETMLTHEDYLKVVQEREREEANISMNEKEPHLQVLT